LKAESVRGRYGSRGLSLAVALTGILATMPFSALQLVGIHVALLQTLPTIVAGLYTRWFHRWALLIGWAVAMAYGTVQAYEVPVPGTPHSHVGGSTAPIPFFGQSGYIALTAFVINLIISVVLTLIFHAAKLPAGTDETLAPHYTADVGEPIVRNLPDLVEAPITAGPEGRTRDDVTRW
jgi:SSS family solute:Na+ symporter